MERTVSSEPPFPSLVPYGWTERVSRLAAPALAEGRQVGRVVRVSRRVDVVRTTAGEVSCSRTSADYRNAALPGPPAVGDWALVASGVGGPAVVGLLPRWGTLSRRDPAGRDIEQVVAADVDVAVLVFGLDRPLRAGRLERALVLAHGGGLAPVVVLSKVDVAREAAPSRRLVDQLAPEVPRIETSTTTGRGVSELRATIARGGTAVLVGESGSGKSSLVNALVGHAVQGVGDVRSADRKGRHTTTGRELFPIAGGGVVIDTPGVRALGLWDDEGVEAAFADIGELAAQCRFRDCAHRGEPGCRVAAAVDAAELSPDRLQRYLALQDEAATIARRRQERDWRRADRTSPGRRGERRRADGRGPPGRAAPDERSTDRSPAAPVDSRAGDDIVPDLAERGGEEPIGR